MAMRALNLKALQQTRFVGLNDASIASKDWAIRIMVNVVDMADKHESALQLLNLLFNPDVMVSKTEVAQLIKTILGMVETTTTDEQQSTGGAEEIKE